MAVQQETIITFNKIVCALNFEMSQSNIVSILPVFL